MKSLNLIMMFLLALVIASCNSTAQSGVEQINAGEAQARAEKGILLVDVRTKGEVQELAYDVKNIVHIPLATLEANLDKIPKDKEVIMVCRSGARSNQAASILVQNGYTKVANMTGGISAWSGATLKNGAVSKLKKKECKKDCQKPCCKKEGDKKECKKGHKKECSAEDMKNCKKGHKKECSAEDMKNCKKGHKKECKKDCKKECCKKDAE